MRKNDTCDAKIVNTRLTKIFIAFFAPDERLPSSATLLQTNKRKWIFYLKLVSWFCYISLPQKQMRIEFLQPIRKNIDIAMEALVGDSNLLKVSFHTKRHSLFRGLFWFWWRSPWTSWSPPCSDHSILRLPESEPERKIVKKWILC